ncbi:protein SUPPRESSOR OF GENE SILENCING 3-like isoform X1 [Malus sylvestris]|uniref:protein SUPPRESSOR OF GENE SILENCING 3-like isoform X1 n=2 Tax=Malus sylvestris TaxID=3752 RepID=UPI0021ACD7CE|nr:protein SUPPRESSOR OF GENE SILENCING 3-like isoform X1 [Malus sylvestris]
MYIVTLKILPGFRGTYVHVCICVWSGFRLCQGRGLLSKMSSRRGDANPKGKQLSQGVASLDSAQDDGEWEVIGKKSKNRSGGRFGPQSSSYKAWGPPPQGVPKTGTHSGAGGAQAAHSQKPAGGRNARHPYNNTGGFGDNFMAPKNVIPPPLDQGWNWQSRAGKKDKNVVPPAAVAEDYDDEDNSDPLSDLDDSDDDLFSDEFDSDSSEKSHGTQKKSKWFKQFFNEFDRLSVDEVIDPARRWHCPACKNGPGAIDWYDGMQPLKRHAETKAAKRVKLHRELAKLIDAELQLKGATVTPVGQVFGRWAALKDEEKNRKVIWPPMVLIMNTKLELQDEYDKWIGMGTEELLDLFDDYHASKARHSYGPQGHCGMSMLIFEASAMGHFEGERLHRHFAEQGFGRDAWERNPVLFRPGLIRQLYGFLPTKRDLDTFNQHCDDKAGLKFDIKSYQEMVLKPTRQMSLDSEEVIRLKDKLPKEMRLRKDAEETNAILREKIEKLQDENRLLKQRIKTQLEENKEEMILQEEFYKDVISRPRD